MKIQLLILNIIAVLFSACTNVDSANTQVVKHVSAQEFNHIIDAGNGVILDIRTPQEVATGHLKNASIITTATLKRAYTFSKFFGKIKLHNNNYSYNRGPTYNHSRGIS